MARSSEPPTAGRTVQSKSAKIISTVLFFIRLPGQNRDTSFEAAIIFLLILVTRHAKHATFELRLNTLLKECNGKRHLDLVFDFYGASGNFHWGDFEFGLL